MDLKKIGILLIFLGIVFTVAFIGNDQVFVPALTITVLGFFMTVLGYVVDIRKQKIVNDQLEVDIANVLQPMITKYSNLNKQYRANYEGEEYAEKRIQLNRDLEKEITEKLPYLESREIKKIVIQFSQEQDKMN
ncbi:MAG: hypothetical protein E7Z78_08560 [Methanobrevibacter thaueri]|jgi:uncharacterized membrane protein|uniref:hypothetical protein n=1 Tax=Methanobrevibacter thaueri TaxID=190975 RepID=UPI0026E92E7B|nr:hypothetical protein [Methanobrevibacter thaueri]MBE6496479.1 hypothetical protein [Methanobrevibacter thaueri]